MIKVPFFSFELAPSELRNEWKISTSRVIDSSKFINGQELKNLELDWSNYVGVDFAVGVGNGLDGLTLALKALNLPKNSKVIVPAHTFIATWTSVHLAGLIPMGVDVTNKGLLDLDALENLDISDISAVIPVHMHGQMVNMDRLTKWALHNNLKVIEDASQCHGCNQSGKKAGSWGDIGVFSFYPTKNLGAIGDAGICTTNIEEYANNIRAIANYGAFRENKYVHSKLGVNSRLDEIQAAILNTNLSKLDNWNDSRRFLANLYFKNLKDLVEISTLKADIESSVWHHFPIFTSKRDELREYLSLKGIQTEIHYPRVAATEYQEFSDSNRVIFPIANKISNEILSLPISPWHTQMQVEIVCKEIFNYFSNSSTS